MISISARGVAAVSALLLFAAPVLAGPLVVRAAGPSAAAFRPGQRLPDAPLVLKAGDEVTVLDAQGTRSFTGPGNFNLAAASTATSGAAAFTSLLTQKPERRARIGAVRGGAPEPVGPPVPPGVWALDASRGGTVCALDPAAISLWRPAPAAAATLTVTRVSDGKSATVSYAAGEAVANWPATLVATSGDQFRISGAAAPMTIHTITPAPAAVDDLGAALLAAGCEAQFERLATVTKVAP